MILTRYELTIDGENNVGLITGGYGLGLLLEEDLAHINRRLPVPKKHRPGHDLLTYFTEEGVREFGYIADIVRRNLASEKNKLGFSLLVKKLDLYETSVAVVYKDKWQFIIKKG